MRSTNTTSERWGRGATIVQGLQDRFWGLRSYHALDLEGYRWSFCQRLTNVPRQMVEAKLRRW